MEELIARLEKATGADRGLDGMIARDVLGWLPYFDLEGERILDWDDFGGHWHLPGDACDGRHSVSRERNPEPPEFTASVDAASALVPEGLSWEVRTSPIENTSGACVWNWRASRARMYEAVNCASPAIALCIAALRARPLHV